jgi:hypothetical protein
MSRANCSPSAVRVTVRSGAQERPADGGLELTDLVGEDGETDAELTGDVVDAGLAADGEGTADALLRATRWPARLVIARAGCPQWRCARRDTA